MTAEGNFRTSLVDGVQALFARMLSNDVGDLEAVLDSFKVGKLVFEWSVNSMNHSRIQL